MWLCFTGGFNIVCSLFITKLPVTTTIEKNGKSEILSSNLQKAHLGCNFSLIALCEKWRANNIALWSQSTFYSLIKLSDPTCLNLWTCFGTQDELTLFAKWTVNIILEVIPLLLWRHHPTTTTYTHTESYLLQKIMDLNHSQSFCCWQLWPLATQCTILG